MEKKVYNVHGMGVCNNRAYHDKTSFNLADVNARIQTFANVHHYVNLRNLKSRQQDWASATQKTTDTATMAATHERAFSKHWQLEPTSTLPSVCSALATPTLPLWHAGNLSMWVVATASHLIDVTLSSSFRHHPQPSGNFVTSLEI